MRRQTSFRILCAIACAAAFGAPSVWPQASDGTVAHLKSVVGNVLVSRETGLASGSDDVPLPRGARVITTSNSEAIVKYDNGCEVRLRPNQRFEVATDRPCEALIAQVESLLAEPVAVAGGVGESGLGGYALLPAIGGAATTLLIIQSRRQGSSVSPS